MLPLDKNLEKYVRASNTSALRLHEHCPAFSEAVRHMDDVSRALVGLNNSQITQFLSLCREVSQAFQLPVHAQIQQGEVIDVCDEIILPVEFPFVFRLEHIGNAIWIVWYIDDGQPLNASSNAFFEFDNDRALQEWLRNIVEKSAVPVRPQINIVFDNSVSAFFLNDGVFNLLRMADGYPHLLRMLEKHRNNSRFDMQPNIPDRDINQLVLGAIRHPLRPAENRAKQILQPVGVAISQQLDNALNWVMGLFNRGEGDALQNASGDTDRSTSANTSFRHSGNNNIFTFTGLNLENFTFPTINVSGWSIDWSTFLFDFGVEAGIGVNAAPFNVSVALLQSYRINDSGLHRHGRASIRFLFGWRF